MTRRYDSKRLSHGRLSDRVLGWVPVWLVDQCDWSGSHPTVKLKAQVPSGAIQLWSWDHRFHLELSKALTHVRCGWSIGVRDRDSLDGSLKNWESAVLWGEVTFTEDVYIYIYIQKKTGHTVDSCYQHQNFGQLFSLKVGTATSRMDDPCWWYFFRFQGGRGRLHQEFQVPKMEGFNKKNLCFLAILEVGKFPYPLAVSIQPIWVVHTSILGTWNVWWFFLGEGGQRLVCKPHEWYPLFPKKCGS